MGSRVPQLRRPPLPAVNPVQAATAAAPSTPEAVAAPTGDFGAVLAAQATSSPSVVQTDGAAPASPVVAPARIRGADGSALPVLTLGQMIAALSGRPVAAPTRTPASAPVTGPGAVAPTLPADAADGERIVAQAKKYLGIPYLWGGTDPAKGLDCSGLLQRVFKDLGVSIPRVSKDQSRVGVEVPSIDQAQPGDLVFWAASSPGGTNHIGIYVGDGQFLHAPRTGDVVKIGPLRSYPPTTIRRIDV